MKISQQHRYCSFACAVFTGLALYVVAASIAAGQNRTVVNAVVSAGDFLPGVANEGLATVFGTALSDRAYQASSLPLPRKLGETELRYCDQRTTAWDQCFPMELVYVGPTQINFRVPPSTSYPFGGYFAARTGGTTESERNVVTVVEAAAPRIFVMGFDCANNPNWRDPSPCGLRPQRIHEANSIRGAVTDQNGQLVLSMNPARVGRYYTLWLTGLGRITNGRLVSELQMRLAGIPVYGFPGDTWMWVAPSFVGYSPQFPGLYQINFQLPKNLMGVSSTEYPPLHPCGEYRLDLAINLGLAGRYQEANIVDVPILIQDGDVPCVR